MKRLNIVSIKCKHLISVLERATVLSEDDDVRRRPSFRCNCSTVNEQKIGWCFFIRMEDLRPTGLGDCR